MKLATDSICVLEAWVPFTKELSVMIVRNQKGDGVPDLQLITSAYSANRLCRPRHACGSQKSNKAAHQIADALQLVKFTLGIEMFLAADDTIFINSWRRVRTNLRRYNRGK